MKGRGRISNGKWAPKDLSAILSRKVRRVLLKQIQVKLCILKFILKRKYCKILYRSGTWFYWMPSNIILIRLNFFSVRTCLLCIPFDKVKKGLQTGI